MVSDRFKSAFSAVLLVAVMSVSLEARDIGASNGDKAIGQEEVIRAIDYVGSNRYGLVIGINDYLDPSIPDLKYCEDDAKAIHDLLTDPQTGGVASDQITLLLGKHATTRQIKSALATLRRIPADSTVFIYYSGHGAKEMGDAFWVTQDAQVNNLLGSGISDMEIKGLLNRIPSERVILIMDCCYAAAMLRDNKALVDFDQLLERFTGKGRAFLSAAGSGEQAIESMDLKRSVFTHYVLSGLAGEADRNGDGVVVLTELTDYVDHHVADQARQRGGVQKPVVDLEQLQEPAKFMLTINAEQLKRQLVEDRQTSQLRTDRLMKLRDLYLDEKLSRELYALGTELIKAAESELTQVQRSQLDEFVAVLDGRLSPDKLKRALDAIAPIGGVGRNRTIQVPADHRTIQAAVDAASAGDTIVVSPGNYQERITFKSGVTLRGVDRDLCTIRIVPGEKQVISVEKCSAGLIENLTIDGQGGIKRKDYTPDGIDLTDSDLIIRNCLLRNHLDYGIQIQGRTSRTIIENSTCENNNVGILVKDRDASPLVRNNQCRLNQAYGIYFAQAASGTIEKNTCNRNSVGGIGAADEGTSPRIIQNTCMENEIVGINLGRQATGKVEMNICTRNKTHGIRLQDKGTSFSLEKNECNHNVHNGIYYDTGSTGDAAGNTCRNNGWSGITIADPGSSAVLTDNDCQQNSNAGIYIGKGGSGIVQDNTCNQNGSAGIMVVDPGTTATIKNNECHENTASGIILGNIDSATVQMNVCTNNQESGITITGEDCSPFIKNNSFNFNRWNGIFFGGGAKGTAQENECRANGIAGIGCGGWGTDPIIRGNVIMDNAQVPINVFENAMPFIAEDNVFGNF